MRAATIDIRVVTRSNNHLLDCHDRFGVGTRLRRLSDVKRLQYVRVIMTHLGYPLYLLTIIGVWKLLATIALLAPR
jgi:DoxX-like family